jgi:hypothetical protein
MFKRNRAGSCEVCVHQNLCLVRVRLSLGLRGLRLKSICKIILGGSIGLPHCAEGLFYWVFKKNKK